MANFPVTLSIASKMKLSKNYSRLSFKDAGVSDIEAVCDAIDEGLAPGIKAQANSKIRWYDLRSLPSANMKDIVTGRVTFYDATGNNKMTVYIPGLKVIKFVSGENAGKIDREATDAQMYAIADVLLAKKIQKMVVNTDGTTTYIDMTGYLSPATGLSQDITQQDAGDVSQTPV